MCKSRASRRVIIAANRYSYSYFAVVTVGRMNVLVVSRTDTDTQVKPFRTVCRSIRFRHRLGDTQVGGGNGFELDV